VTLDEATTSRRQLDATRAILERLEEADRDGVVSLRAEGVSVASGASLSMAYDSGLYAPLDGSAPMTSDELIDAARRRELVVTVTARIGPNSDVDHPQPALWLPPDRSSPGANKLQEIPELTDKPIVLLFGRHVVDGAGVLIDGRAVEATVTCGTDGTLPLCEDERTRIRLESFPTIGEHTLQVATPGGLLSNEVLIRSRTCPEAATFDSVDCRLGALLASLESVDLGPLQSRLRRLVELAKEAMDVAQERSAEDRSVEVRRRLRSVMSRLRLFLRRLDSAHAEQSIPPEVRLPLVDEATAIRDDVTTLRDGIA
jgi:hypothetical protein